MNQSAEIMAIWELLKLGKIWIVTEFCEDLKFNLTGLIWHAIMPLALQTTRGGAVAARRAHNPKVPGSSPGPATVQDLSRTAPDRC